MLDDMHMRKRDPRTQEAYVRALRNSQLHLVDTGASTWPRCSL
jgi:hypothetical protein